MRFTPTFTPSSVFVRELDGRGRSFAPERIWGTTLPQHPSPHLRTPPNRHLTPSDPLSAPFGQVLALRDQTLMDRTGEDGDAAPAAHLETINSSGTGGVLEHSLQVLGCFLAG